MKNRVRASILGLLCVGSVSCTRTIHVTKQMTWECSPDEYKSTFYAKPEEYVRFRFVENPRCEEVETSKNFCSELRKAGRSVVKVEFDVWGHGTTLQGYRMTAVDGRPIQDVGGWGGSGANDYSGPHPLDLAMGAHK